MHIQLIRHATLSITIHGTTFLVDPMFARDRSFSPLTIGGRKNPATPLPCPAAPLTHCDAVLITHTHFDHFDKTAARIIPKSTPIICPAFARAAIRKAGFTDITVASDSPLTFKGIEIRSTPARHGRGFVKALIGKSSGFLIGAPGMTELYLTGDTVWCDEVKTILTTHHPRVIVANAGAAQFTIGGPITLCGADLCRMAETLPDASIVAVHLDTLDHCRESRLTLSSHLNAMNLSARIHIPADGQTITLQ